jgi:hypothetical protein
LPLYTHPLLQEGMAVAFGGRGGLDPRTLVAPGVFLFRSGFVEPSGLLSTATSVQLDPSIGYPAAGLLTSYLVESLGMDGYLQLYRKHSGRATSIETRLIEPYEIGEDASWQSFLAASGKDPDVEPDSGSPAGRAVYTSDACRIVDEGAWYHVELDGDLLVPSKTPVGAYQSRTFRELLPDQVYAGQRYLLRARTEEISVYDLFTNTLVASYAVAFAGPAAKIPVAGGRASFRVRKSVFEEPLERLLEGRSPPIGH